jgi:sugar phosphate isomerase/epimerase
LGDSAKSRSARSRRRTRRSFLSLAETIAAGSTGGQSLVQAAEPESPQIGILLGATFRTGTLAAAARGITIASTQGTFNMSHPDPEHRRTGLRRLRVLAEACPQMGTSSIHVCTGTRDQNSMWRRHPDNGLPQSWREMAACMREATDIARQANVVLAFEPEVNNVVDSARKARRLLDEIGSPRLKVTFAKDLDHDGDAGHKAAGQGVLDYDRYLHLLRKYRFKGPLPLHGLSAAQVPGCVAFLRAKLPA